MSQKQLYRFSCALSPVLHEDSVVGDLVGTSVIRSCLLCSTEDWALSANVFLLSFLVMSEITVSFPA